VIKWIVKNGAVVGCLNCERLVQLIPVADAVDDRDRFIEGDIFFVIDVSPTKSWARTR
jgi:hypothetical protein